MDFLHTWFGGFEESLEKLSPKECEKLFSSCGRRCAESGVVNYYKELYVENGGMDGMFKAFSGDVRGRVIESGRRYEIIFPHCLCDLHNCGYINSGKLCECSRQSIIHVMQTLAPQKEISVRQLGTVLCGDPECCFSIEIK